MGVAVSRIVLKYAAKGAEAAARADRMVRDGVVRTARIARQQAGIIGRWLKAHGRALTLVGVAMTGLLAGLIAASPVANAHLSGIRLAFSLLADEIFLHLEPAFLALEDGIYKVIDAYAALPAPLQAVIAWTIAIIGILGGLILVVGGLAKAFSVAVPSLIGFAGWLTASATAALAFAAVLGVLLGGLIVWVFDVTGVFDMLEHAVDAGFSKIDGWAKDVIITILGVMLPLQIVGAFIVAFLRGEGWSGAVANARGVLEQWVGAWQRTLGRLQVLVGIGVSWLVGQFNNLGGWLRSFASRDAGSAVSWGSGIMAGIVNGLRGGLGTVAQAIFQVRAKFFDWLGGLASRAWQWGRDVMSNLAAGVRAGIWMLVRAVQSAASAFNPLKFDIEANDRMAQRWGRDLVKHFGLGLERGTVKIETAATGAVPGPGGGFPFPPPPSGGGGGLTVVFERGSIVLEGTGSQGFDEERLVDRIAERISDRTKGRAFS